MLNPGFFLGEVSRSLEVRPCPHAREAKRLQFLDEFSYGRYDGGVGSAFYRQGFVCGFGRVSRCSAIDQDRAIEITVAWIDSFYLVFFHQSFLLEE